MPANRLEFAKIWAGTSNYYYDEVKLWSGYSKIPYGQKLVAGLGADLKNTGSGTQNNLKFIAKELTTNTLGTSPTVSLGMFANDTLEVDSLIRFENVGNYKMMMYATSDSINQLI